MNECLQKNKSARVCFGHLVILSDTQLTERLKGAKSVVGIGGIYDIPSILYMFIWSKTLIRYIRCIVMNTWRYEECGKHKEAAAEH